MKTILFSALFGAEGRPERVRFLEQVQDHIGSETKLVAFNTSGEVQGNLTIMNAQLGRQMRITEPLDALCNLLDATCPAQSQRMLEHIDGEFGHNPASYDRNVCRHVLLTQAFLRALDAHNPDHVFLWNQFNALHRHFAHILDARGISYGFFHDGVLPGSIAFDIDGEMGESWIARDPELFQSAPLDATDLDRAQAFFDDLARQTVDRHVQQDDISVQEALMLAKSGDRPLVLYAGQADWHAGVRPDGPSRALHSPLYASTLDALEHLDAIAGELGITILFKPHPLTRERFTFLEAEDYPNTVILSSVTLQSCLDAADLVATIASQTCYVALMAGKPVLMLGRNQITGKGLTYDATSKDTLGALILEALEDPLAPTRAQDLAAHAARLEHLYLFDFGTLETGFYRRGPAQAAQLMSQSLEHSKTEIITNLLHAAP